MSSANLTIVDVQTNSGTGAVDWTAPGHAAVDPNDGGHPSDASPATCGLLLGQSTYWIFAIFDQFSLIGSVLTSITGIVRAKVNTVAGGAASDANVQLFSGGAPLGGDAHSGTSLTTSYVNTSFTAGTIGWGAAYTAATLANNIGSGDLGFGISYTSPIASTISVAAMGMSISYIPAGGGNPRKIMLEATAYGLLVPRQLKR